MQNLYDNPFDSAAEMGFTADDAGETGYNAVNYPVRLEPIALLQLAEAKGTDTDELKGETYE